MFRPKQLKSILSSKDSKSHILWQQEFYHAASSANGPQISPEPGKMLGIDGKIDFYVNDNYNWAIELVSEGDRLQLHLNRFIETRNYILLYKYQTHLLDQLFNRYFDRKGLVCCKIKIYSPDV